jgi:hypothetical protein
MSVFVSSMDSGAAGCDEMNAKKATGGLGVNGLASTVWNTAVGGTQFDDVSSRSTYWAASNDPVTQASALGYIPELAWNESIAGGDLLWPVVVASAASTPSPRGSSVSGVVADGKRDLPDLAFAAAVQDPYKLNVDKQVMGAGGTSAATPLFASIMGLVLQKTGQAQGLVNPVLYTLAYNQNYNGGPAIFHDVVKGNNTVPGQTGYTTGPGFDMVTGLGSVDAAQLVNHWQEGLAAPGFQLAAASPSASVSPGASTTTSLHAQDEHRIFVGGSVLGNRTAGGRDVDLCAGVAGGGGQYDADDCGCSIGRAPGVYAVNVVGHERRDLTLGVGLADRPDCAIAQPFPVSAPSLDVAAGASKSLALTTTARQRSFKAAVTLSVSGAAKGITVTLSPATIAAPGAGSSDADGEGGVDGSGRHLRGDCHWPPEVCITKTMLPWRSTCCRRPAFRSRSALVAPDHRSGRGRNRYGDHDWQRYASIQPSA